MSELSNEYKANRFKTLYKTFRICVGKNKMFEDTDIDIKLLIPWFKSIYPELSIYIADEYCELSCNDKFFEDFEIEVYKSETEDEYAERIKKDKQDLSDMQKYGGYGTCAGTVESYLDRKSRMTPLPVTIKKSYILEELIRHMSGGSSNLK